MDKCIFCEKNCVLRKDGFCSVSCFNKKTKETPISGYKKCLWCSKGFPYRESALVRGSYCKRLGQMVGGITQKFCSQQCALYYRNKNENPSLRDDVREKSSERAISSNSYLRLHTPEAREKRIELTTGSKHWNWQGGKTPGTTRLRNTKETRGWREMVFTRDDFTCQECGTRGSELNADHIKPWSLFPELRWDISNGRTLCVDCHRETDTYGGRIKNYKINLN